MTNKTKAIEPFAMSRIIRPRIVYYKVHDREKEKHWWQMTIQVDARGPGRAKSAGRQLFTIISVMHALADLLNATIEYTEPLDYNYDLSEGVIEFLIQNLSIIHVHKES